MELKLPHVTKIFLLPPPKILLLKESKFSSVCSSCK